MIFVKDDIFNRFIRACEEARKPNKALVDAVAFTKTQQIKLSDAIRANKAFYKYIDY